MIMSTSECSVSLRKRGESAEGGRCGRYTEHIDELPQQLQRQGGYIDHFSRTPPTGRTTRNRQVLDLAMRWQAGFPPLQGRQQVVKRPLLRFSLSRKIIENQHEMDKTVKRAQGMGWNSFYTSFPPLDCIYPRVPFLQAIFLNQSHGDRVAPCEVWRSSQDGR